MSDFLTNLAVRGSGSGTPIQPRLPSRFEPQRPPVSPLGRQFFTAGEEVQEIDRSVDSEPQPARRPKVRGPIAARPSQTATQQAEIVPAEEDRAPGPRREMRSKIVQEGRVDAIPTLVSSHASALERRAFAADRTHVLKVVEERSIERGQRESVREVTREAVSPIETRRGEEPSRPPDTPISREEIERLVRAMAPQRVESRFNRGSDREPSRAKAPDPTIQVTIGRIEIRAQEQHSRMPKERAASSVMSLDEYLKQRRSSA